MPPRRARRGEFESFVEAVEPRLRRALVAAYGSDDGREATVTALTWAWRHWAEVQQMTNPGGYLFRVGQSHAVRSLRRRRRHTRSEPNPQPPEPWFEPALLPALAQLTVSQRTAVVLSHGLQWTQREVAELLDVSPSTVQNHVERGLAKLRCLLEVDGDA